MLGLNHTWNHADFQEIPKQILIYKESQQLKSRRIKLIFKELDKKSPTKYVMLMVKHDLLKPDISTSCSFMEFLSIIKNQN